MTPLETYLAEVRSRAAKAHRKLCDACADKNKFIMSIPPEEDDTDMAIQASIDDADKLLAIIDELYACLREIRSRGYTGAEFVAGEALRKVDELCGEVGK